MTGTEHSLTGDDPRRVRQGADALQRLSELAINAEAIITALRAGELSARQADEFSPVTAAGTQQWNGTVQELRRNLAIDGWLVRNPNNSPRIVRPDGQLSIAVVSGNLNTGIPFKEPRNAHLLGPTVDASVVSNRLGEVTGQLVFESVEEAAIADAASTPRLDPNTWILLYVDDPVNGVRAELSHPDSTADRFISHWLERIIIPGENTMDETLPIETPVEDVHFDIREA
ncbi:hypothetical protein [Brevibacterium oceani]|uniref:hypothetical protein n=1 Tax=Brevibacterium oceani TaxID=358099 RepID=UPI001B3428B2|nr:hypothetical protein [Brevibacterium oceani]